MKNLKRVLSMALASVMLMGMMVIGASADYTDFTDKDEIKHTSAVQLMTALNVLNGKDDGSYYDPQGSLTRAEMAKIIVFVLHGGEEPALPSGSSSAFTDTADSWAKGYIEYCASTGIINGVGGGKFDPTGTLTGSQAAKMLLVAMGYNATVFGLEGTDWEINTNVEANKAGLYASLSGIDPSAIISRDDAAQLVANALDADMMKRTWALDTSTGKMTETYQPAGTTLMAEKFNTLTRYGYMTKASYDEDTGKYTYTFTTAGVHGDAITGTTALTLASLKSTTDYSNLFGSKVKVVYKDNTAKTVCGMYAADSSVIVSGALGDLPTINADATTVKIDGETYKLEDEAQNIMVYDYNTSTSAALSAHGGNAWDAYEMIDTDDDGKIDVVVAHPTTFGQVTYVGTNNITVGGNAYKFAECDIYEGVAKDDYVVITAKANTVDATPVIEKLDFVEGTVDGAKTANSQFRVDGNWYTLATGVLNSLSSTSFVSGDTIKVAVLNGYIVGGKKTSGGAVLADVLYVAATKSGANTEITATLGTYSGDDTRVILADGTNTVVKAMRVDATTVPTGISAASSDLRKVVPAPGLYTYTVNSNGVYELKAVKDTGHAEFESTSIYSFDAANLAGMDAIATDTTHTDTAAVVSPAAPASYTFDASAAKINNTYFIADEAVVYIIQNSDATAAGTYSKAKVISGEDLKSMSDFGGNAIIMHEKVNGLATAQVAVIYTKNTIGATNASTGYGYVTSSGVTSKDADGNYVVEFTAWTANGQETLTDVTSGLTSTSGNTTAIYGRGAFITFTYTNKAGEVTDLSAITHEGAISGFDGGKNVAIDVNGTEKACTLKSDDKTVIIFVDTAAVEGIEGAFTTANLAQKLADNSYVKNVVYNCASNADNGELDVMFIDVNNSLTGAGYTVTVTCDDAVTNNGITYTASTAVGGTPVADGDSVAADSDITVSIAVSGTADATATGKYKVTLTAADGTTEVRTFTVSEVATEAPTAPADIHFTMPAQKVTSIVFAVNP